MSPPSQGLRSGICENRYINPNNSFPKKNEEIALSFQEENVHHIRDKAIEILTFVK